MTGEGTEQPQVAAAVSGTTLALRFSGDWVMQPGLPMLADVLDEVSGELDGVERLELADAGIGSWDTALLPLVQAAHREAQARDWGFSAEGLPAGVRRLLALATAVPEKTDARRSMEDKGFFEEVGEYTLEFRKGVDTWFEFIGLLFFAFGRLARGRAQARWRDFALVVEDAGARAFPIVTLISFLVGLIITFLGIVVLIRFNAEYYVSYLVGYGMLREMGALMTAVILAGRTGAAFAAQIGSMKVNEEVDALRATGVDPVDFLVLPRVGAMLLMLPLLTIYADVIGILSGMMVADSMQDMAPQIFTKGLLEAVTVADFLLGLLKSVVFGAIIAVSGCLRGLHCGKDANAVGQAATSAVVTCITLIVAFNALIDWLAALFNV